MYLTEQRVAGYYRVTLSILSLDCPFPLFKFSQDCQSQFLKHLMYHIHKKHM